MIIAALTFCGSFFSACTDEAENIIPQPTTNNNEPAATVGTGTEDDDPMK